MLDAELSGKVPQEVARLENLLTSTVFGILKFIPPPLFWPGALQRALRADGTSLADLIAHEWAPVDTFTHLKVRFWPRHHELGEPDLLAAFHTDAGPRVCLIFEVKLDSGKSSSGEHDQLIRYLRLLDSQTWVSNSIGLRRPLVSPGLVYVTPRQSWIDLEDSAVMAPDPEQARRRLFLLQWQDILEVASVASERAPVPFGHMLADVAAFLRHRELAFFGGFTHKSTSIDPDLPPPFWATRQFRGFDELPLVLEDLGWGQ